MSPTLQNYWRTKRKNMNVIVFVQSGKRSHMAFEDDAIKLQKIFKKKLRKNSIFLMIDFWFLEINAAKKLLFEMKIPVMIMNEIDDP